MNSHTDYTRPGVEPWWESSPISSGDPVEHDGGSGTA